MCVCLSIVHLTGWLAGTGGDFRFYSILGFPEGVFLFSYPYSHIPIIWSDASLVLCCI